MSTAPFPLRDHLHVVTPLCKPLATPSAQCLFEGWLCRGQTLNVHDFAYPCKPGRGWGCRNHQRSSPGLCVHAPFLQSLHRALAALFTVRPPLATTWSSILILIEFLRKVCCQADGVCNVTMSQRLPPTLFFIISTVSLTPFCRSTQFHSIGVLHERYTLSLTCAQNKHGLTLQTAPVYKAYALHVPIMSCK